MLSTFLSQLQNYFSKYFIVGSFVPVLAFGFLNGGIAYFLFTGWRVWVDKNLINSSVGRGAFFSTSLTVAMIVTAYVLSSLGVFLRRQLEGRSWPWSSTVLVGAQSRRRALMRTELLKAATDRVDLEQAPEWEQEMRTARELGRSDHQGQQFVVPNPDNVEETLSRLERRAGIYEAIDIEDLETTVHEIAKRFRGCDAEAGGDFTLSDQQQRLVTLIDYATERAHARYARLQNEFNSSFGEQDLAATRMGNVANTIQSYALRRYHCNFESVWSNLQRIVEKDDKAREALAEGKTQLDFLVACCWLTLISAVGWALAFGFIEPTRTGFLSASIGGPIVSYVWYRVATEQYRSFADIAMTSLDIFRLDLLREMRLKIPADVEDERNMWEQIDLLSTYGQNQNFRYEAPKG